MSLSRPTENGPEDFSTGDFFKDEKSHCFAVPGAFDSRLLQHPHAGFVVNADAILEKVDAIGCMAVNDAFVMDAWQKDQNAEHITMLADGNAEFTKALGLELDACRRPRHTLQAICANCQ